MAYTIPATGTQLTDQFRALGVQPGGALMLHTSVKAVGPVLGGPNTLVQALLAALTPAGTLMMYAGWHDFPYLDDFPEEQQAWVMAHHPPFDPAIARAVRDNSLLAECLRTWPGAQRSGHPEASMVAVGARAAWLTADHPMQYSYGVGSPLAKLVEAGGQVLMLGAPLDTITLLHHAEYLAQMRHKNQVHYRCPVLRDGETVWLDFEDYDTGETHDDYEFEDIARDYLAAGRGRQGRVGEAASYLFDAADLTAYAVAWLETRFGA